MERIVIRGGRPLQGKVRAGGAKNAVLKLMAAALLGEGPSRVRNVPRIRDVELMRGVLEYLGAEARWLAPGVLEVNPRGPLGHEAPDYLVRAMRASVQVMGPILARLGRVKVSLPGGCAIGARPVDLHVKGLRALGARMEESHGYLIGRAQRLTGATVHLDLPSVGATENLMMAACLARGTTVIHNAAREPEVVEVQEFLNRMGARIRGAGTSTIRVDGVDRLGGADYEVVADRIEAGTFLAAAALTGGDVAVENAVCEHLEAVLAKLREVGCRVEVGGDGSPVRVRGPEVLRPTAIRTQPYPGFPTDLQPQFTAVLSRAAGASIVTETVHTARFKHVDELRRMGADILVDGQVAVIRGVARLSGAPVEAPDLRAGAALILAGLAAEGETEVEGVHHVDRGYESLETKLQALGAEIRRAANPRPAPTGRLSAGRRLR